MSDIFEKDKTVRSYALNLWANWIETGDVLLSASDAIQASEQHKVRPLSQDQIEFVVRLRKLAEKELT